LFTAISSTITTIPTFTSTFDTITTSINNVSDKCSNAIVVLVFAICCGSFNGSSGSTYISTNIGYVVYHNIYLC